MSQQIAQPKKSGFAVIVGRSNVGKSTLINNLVGSKVAITSPKPQTTRLPIQGILTAPEGQVVFVDTPGVMQKARDSLTKKLLESVKESLRDVDMILYVVDPTRAIGDEEKFVMRLVENLEIPKILVINKIDVFDAPYLDHYRDLAPKFTDTVEISARTGAHIQTLIEKIFAQLKEGEGAYPDYQLTNVSNERWVAELIREKLFLRLHKEVPYTTHVEVEEIDRRENGTLYIKATIYTTEERYKRMIIGAGGRGIKEIGQSTRNELEVVMNTNVFLDLTVEVDPHWVERL
jgi:GTP-binding protein Era